MLKLSVEHNFLVLVEVVKVKGFLFSSSKLKSMRGASFLLDRLNLEKAPELFKDYEEDNKAEKIYFAGANNKAIFADKQDAQDFVAELKAAYENQAPGVKLVTVIEEIKDGENLSDVMQRGMNEVKKSKNEGFTKNVAANSFAKYCPVCGENPVNQYSKDIEKLLCFECDKKIENGKEINRLKKVGSDKLGFKDFIYNMFFEEVEREVSDVDVNQINLPKTISDIADDNNYIGFIYADGNRIGSFLQDFNNNHLKGITKNEDYINLQQTFSSSLDLSTKKSVIKATIKHFKDEIERSQQDNKVLPIEFVLAGADDLMMIVPGNKALEVAKTFVEEFEYDINQRLAEEEKLKDIIDSGTRITTSAGIAIAKPSYPASFLFDYSAQLLKQAKVRSNILFKSYQDQAGVKSNYCTIDFDIIGDSSVRDVKDKRKELYQKDDTYLTLRPYIAAKEKEEELSDLLYLDYLIETVRDLKQKSFPKVKLRQFFDALQLEKNEAILESLRLSSRLSNDEHQDLIKGLYEKRAEKQGVFPWLKLDEDAKFLTTDILDVVEAYDFIKE